MKLDEISREAFFNMHALSVIKHVADAVGIPSSFLRITPPSHSSRNNVHVILTIDPKHGEPYSPEGLEHDMLIHVIPLAIKDAFKKIGDHEVEVEDIGESWTANRYKYRWKVTSIR